MTSNTMYMDEVVNDKKPDVCYDNSASWLSTVHNPQRKSNRNSNNMYVDEVVNIHKNQMSHFS
jgi:hypothetical protein